MDKELKRKFTLQYLSYQSNLIKELSKNFQKPGTTLDDIVDAVGDSFADFLSKEKDIFDANSYQELYSTSTKYLQEAYANKFSNIPRILTSLGFENPQGDYFSKLASNVDYFSSLKYKQGYIYMFTFKKPLTQRDISNFEGYNGIVVEFEGKPFVYIYSEILLSENCFSDEPIQEGLELFSDN